MIWILSLLLILAAALALCGYTTLRLPVRRGGAKRHIACVGDSVTYGCTLPLFFLRRYPAVLQKLLGPDAQVAAFAVNDRTLQSTGNKPYRKEKAFSQSKAFLPDTVVILLGTNDSKDANWISGEAFRQQYRELIDEYRAVLGDSLGFVERLQQLTDDLASCRAAAKEDVERAERKYKKQIQEHYDGDIANLEYYLSIAKEAVWLYDKFGEGEYRDIPGLCKVAQQSEIEAKGWSLTPGAYVGVAPVEDDGVDFKARMAEIHAELLSLQAQSSALMETISRNMEELGI